MAKEVIIIDSHDRDIVQKADIEMSSRMNLISFIISKNMDISNERFKQYEQEYKDAFLAFESAKDMIAKKYVPNLTTNWSLDYVTCALTDEE